MSSSVAPLFPKTSIFVPAFWEAARGEILTEEEADARYLRFPVGQGTESIPNLIVSGSSTLGIVSASTLSQSGTYTSTNSATPANQVIINNTTPSITITDGTNTNTITPTSSGAVGTLQQVLNTGNTATGANAKIGLTNTDVGYISSPQITLNNSRTDAGNSVGVPSMEYFKSGRNTIANDIVASQHFYAKNYAGTKTEFAKIETNVRNTGAGNDDGSIGFFGLLNGVQTEFCRMNGADGDNNFFKPIDMNGQAIVTTLTNLDIKANASTGGGQITIQPKTGSNLTIATTPAGTNFTRINADGTGINLQQISGGFTGTLNIINNVFSQSYLFIQQNFGSLLKYMFVKCDAALGNSLESFDYHTPAIPFKIKTDNGSFASSNSSIEFEMNPNSNPIVLAQLTFTYDNTLGATSSFVPDHYIPVLIAGTQYYIPITTSPI